MWWKHYECRPPQPQLKITKVPNPTRKCGSSGRFNYLSSYGMWPYVTQRRAIECTIFICLGKVPDHFMEWDSIPLSNVYSLISKHCTFLVFYPLGVGDIPLLVYESRAKFFNSSSKLYTAFPKTVEKLNRLEERGCALGSPWDHPKSLTTIFCWIYQQNGSRHVQSLIDYSKKSVDRPTPFLWWPELHGARELKKNRVRPDS